MTAPDESRIGTREEREPLLLFLFLVYLATACLVLTPLADINAGKWFLIRLAGPLLFGGWLLRRSWTGRRTVVWDPVTALAAAFLALHVLSLAIAPNAGYAGERISNLVGLLSALFLAAHLSRDRRGRAAILWMLLFVGAATSAYGIAQHFGHDFFHWQTTAVTQREVPVTRGVSFFGHATFSASVLILILPIGAALAIASRWPGRLFAMGCTLLMLYHLSFSGARMATLAFLGSFAAAGLWRVLRYRGRRPAAHAFSTGRVAAIILLLVVLGGAGSWFVVRAWQTKGGDVFAIRQSSLALRFYNWETASRMFMDHMLLGVGAGNYEIVSPRYWNDIERTRTSRYGRWMQQTHNDYLQTAVELGLPGVAVLLGIFAYAVTLSLSAAAHAIRPVDRWIGLGLFTSVAAIALDANTTFSLQAPGSALVFWTVLGLISGLYAELRAETGRVGGESSR